MGLWLPVCQTLIYLLVAQEQLHNCVTISLYGALLDVLWRQYQILIYTLGHEDVIPDVPDILLAKSGKLLQCAHKARKCKHMFLLDNPEGQSLLTKVLAKQMFV